MDANQSRACQPLTTGEKLGYAAGDVASNIYWRVIDVFLFIFYTDVFGLPAATVGTMMLVTRLIDAFSDPAMGALADRTRTRFGRFRPYLVWGILPLAGAGVLTFTVPDLGDGGKVLWAYGTYIALMLAYTFINVPYGALMGVMSGDSQQRTTLTAFRFIGAFSGGSAVAYFTPELVNWFGQGDEAYGWQATLMLYGGIAAALFLVSFFTTRERVPAPPQSDAVSQDLRDLLANRPWLVLFALAMVIMMTISLRASSGTFYLKYVVQREDLIGSFTLCYMLSLALGAAITPLLTRFFDKRKLLMGLMGLVALLCSLFYLLPPDALVATFVLHGLIGLALGPKSPLVFSMYADTADYSHWRTGRRATAMVFSAAAFAQKLGGAAAGATIGYLLASLGYEANVVQSDASSEGIRWLMSLIPALFAALSAWIIYFYPLDSSTLERIQTQLFQREPQS
ncbi:MFS transporter [Ferrimonas marina]|uniref:Glycoside/pentoside/hexuronide:cation symporter, GPH family n=1 Tax=Ferrimonas marina TaxID=299255 RepID=A0A1M5NQR0_9GAMM|nr:MFS transporter [Ferrimonas marina]SHG91850.1 glycoside/pentoside/hexuronide:cation symporter, GPH family [Ferrimonas marina]